MTLSLTDSLARSLTHTRWLHASLPLPFSPSLSPAFRLSLKSLAQTALSPASHHTSPPPPSSLALLPFQARFPALPLLSLSVSLCCRLPWLRERLSDSQLRVQREREGGSGRCCLVSRIPAAVTATLAASSLVVLLILLFATRTHAHASAVAWCAFLSQSREKGRT